MEPVRAQQLLARERKRIEQAIAGVGESRREAAAESDEPDDGSENL
jgi:hypothetical protein